MNDRTCSSDACENRIGSHGARGMCSKHYAIWRRANPLGVKISRPYPPTATAIERLVAIGWDKKPGGCWEWRGTRDRGYGIISLSKKSYRRAHIVAYEGRNGAITHGQVVRHTCDNPPCVNPTHLIVGTQKQNIHDALKRNRFRPHGRIPGCGLTADDHKDIRALWGTNGWTQKKLAEQYQVGATTIFRILHAES